MAEIKIYFSHDANARGNKKIIALRMKHGWAGYGLFWAIIEKLREENGYMLPVDYNVLSFDLRADTAQVKSIINDFGLFSFTHTEKGECFYSESLMERMAIKDEASERARQKANKRWNKSNANEMLQHTKSDTTALQEQCDSNAIKDNISKVKESKVKETSNTVEFDEAFTFLKDTRNHRMLMEKHRLTEETILTLFREFYDSKVDLGDLNLKNVSEIARHFGYWVPKYLNATKNGTDQKNTPKFTNNGTAVIDKNKGFGGGF